MRVATTAAFNQFLIDNGHSYPYGRLQSTRSSFFCKWVMMKGHVTGVTEYFPLLANSFSNGVLLEMIITGRAKPFPPELSEIMDHMHWWGKNHDLEWYNQVVEMMDETLNKEEEVERSELVSIFVSPLVLKEIHANHFAVDSVMEHLLVIEWMKWYMRTYKKGDRTPAPFRTIAEKSVVKIKWAIDRVNTAVAMHPVSSNSAA